MSGDDAIPAPVTLGLEDGGREVPVALGQEVVLRLEENPTTGVRWSLPDDGFFEVLEDRNEAAGAGIGAASVRVLRLRPRAAGKAHLHLQRQQAWEPDTTTDAELSLDIVVQ